MVVIFSCLLGNLWTVSANALCKPKILYKLPTFFIFIFCLFLVFEEPEDPSNRSFFSEIISSISDVKFSHSGRYMMTRDYLSVKIWDLNMENRPVETYQVFTLSSFNNHIPYLLLNVYREWYCINMLIVIQCSRLGFFLQMSMSILLFLMLNLYIVL